MEINRKSNTPMMEPKQNGVKKDYFHVPLDTHNGVNKSFLYKRYKLVILLFEELEYLSTLESLPQSAVGTN